MGAEDQCDFSSIHLDTVDFAAERNVGVSHRLFSLWANCGTGEFLISSRITDQHSKIHQTYVTRSISRLKSDAVTPDVTCKTPN